MNNMLSIMIPVAPGNEARLRSLLSRITLAEKITPEYDFEVIVCDGGSSDDTKSLCEFVSDFIPLKYIYVPIYKHINPSYPINIMTRVAEGQYLCYMSVDYYPSEYFLKVIDNLQLSEHAIAFGQIYRRAQVDPNNEKLPAQLLDQKNAGLKFVDIVEETQMFPDDDFNSPMWAATRQLILGLDGFYENMSKDINMFVSNCSNVQVYTPRPYFSAIHIYHKQKEKARICTITARCGTLTEYSFSIINGVSREPDAHELWIKDNVPDVESYVLKPVGEM